MLTLILKGTNGCNLNCAYCSLGEKSRHDIVSDQTLMRILNTLAIPVGKEMSCSVRLSCMVASQL